VAKALHGAILGMDPYTVLVSSFSTCSSIQFVYGARERAIESSPAGFAAFVGGAAVRSTGRKGRVFGPLISWLAV
jgi:hypothetical protein